MTDHEQTLIDASPLRGMRVDIRHAARALRRRPTLFAGVVAALAVGLVANGIAASLAMAYMIAPPPGISDASRVYRVSATSTSRPAPGILFSDEETRVMRRAVGQGDAILWYMVRDELVDDGQSLRHARVAYFGGDLRAVMSGLETGDFGTTATIFARPKFIARAHATAGHAAGLALRIGGVRQVVGAVVSPSFEGFDAAPVDLWVPLPPQVSSAPLGDAVRVRDLRVIVRIGRQGSRRDLEAVLRRTLTTLQSNLSADDGSLAVSVRRVVRADPETNAGLRGVAVSVFSTALLALAVAVINASQLLVTRALERGPELAVRAALGASSWLVLRTLATEAILLCAAACAAAAIAYAAAWFALQTMTATSLSLGPTGIGAAAVTVLSLAVVCVVALAILTRSTWTRLADHLRSAGGLERVRTRRWRNVFLGLQSSCAALLLALSGLLVELARSTTRLDFGMDVDRTILVQPMSLGSSDSPNWQLYRRLQAVVATVSGVEATSISTAIPLRSSFGTYIRIPGRAREASLPTGGPYISAVDPTFPRATGARLIAGRFFDSTSSMEPVVVVNATASHVYWPDGPAVGRCLYIGRANKCARVVGVIEDVRRESLLEGATAQLYVPMAQVPSYLTPAVIFVHARSSVTVSAAMIARAVSTSLPGLRVDIHPLRNLTERERQFWSGLAALVTAAAIVGMITAIIGVFSLAAYHASSMRRELGIRLAVGARPSTLVWSTVFWIGRSVTIGATIGGFLAIRLVSKLWPAAADPRLLSAHVAFVALLAMIALSISAAANPVAALLRGGVRPLLSD